MFANVDWQAFDWQSFATLVTGLAAVGAAAVIGLKQSRIQQRQASIQDTELRLALFDRRFSVFRRTEQYLREILQHAASPSRETEMEFLRAMGEARFLFSPAVLSGLDLVWKQGCEFHALKVVMDRCLQTEGHHGVGNPEKEAAALNWFHEYFRGLPMLFDEMRLS